MQASLALLAELVHGRLVGDGGVTVCGAAPLGQAQAGQITFLDAIGKAPLLEKSSASAAVVPSGFSAAKHAECSTIEVDDVHEAFAAIHRHLHPPRVTRRIGVSAAALVSPTARVGPDVDIHPGATIGDDVQLGEGSTIHCGVHIMAGCRIGRGVTIFPNAVLYEDTVVGDHVIIHAGAVLGAYGYGYRLVEGRHQLSAQLGNVVIERHVEIGACSTIDRGTYGTTRVGEGTKLDNQVQIGHNGQVGRHNLFCSQSGIAGSVTTGDYVVLAGQVGVRDHVHVGEGAQLGAQAGVRKDVPPGGKQVGTPAEPVREQAETWAMQRKLPEMRKQLRQLEKAVAELERRAAEQRREAA